MKNTKYRKLVTATIAYYGFSTIYDFLTSIVLLIRGGFVELNPIGQMLGVQYWFVYWALSIILPVILLEFGNRWAFLLLWVPTGVHFACVANNNSLIGGF